MKNYIDHEIKVKFNDGIYERSKDWQWFIAALERDFTYDNFVISTWDDYLKIYRDVSEIYDCFIKINQISNFKLKFTKSWLQKIYLISLIFNKKKDISAVWDKMEDDFFKLFALIVFTTTLHNNANPEKYLYSTYVFTQNNVFNLFDLSEILMFETEILSYMKEIKIRGIRKLKHTFINNLQNITIPYNKKLFDKNVKYFLSSDAFHFQRIHTKEQLSWQEMFLYDMINIRIEKRKIVPALNMQGYLNPDFNRWTPNILSNMKSYFNRKEVNFILESIDYILYNNVPSDETIAIHFDLEIKHLSKLKQKSTPYKVQDSSFEVIKYLLEDKKISENIKQHCMKDFALALQKFKNPQTISMLKDSHMPISKAQIKKLKTYNSSQASQVKDISSIVSFKDYCLNEYVPKSINEKHICKLIELFNQFIEANESMTIIVAFHSFMILLMRSKQSSNIKNINIEHMMIELKSLWQNTYYEKCINLMKEIEYSQTFKNEDINKHNNLFITHPMVIVKNCIPLSSDGLLDLMSQISQNVFSIFCTKYTISGNYPFIETDDFAEEHEIDSCMTSIIKALIENKGYKLLNVFEVQTYIKEIYKSYIQNIIFNFSLFNEYKSLYNNLKEELNTFKLLNFEDDICLGHLTQLFPILENKIRELGTYYGVVPFKETEKDFLQLKDPSNVLIKLLLEYYAKTNEFTGVSDLFFIYQTMYSSSLLNIRNECIHGNAYQNNEDLLFAFKLTIFCMKLVLNRINKIKNKM